VSLESDQLLQRNFARQLRDPNFQFEAGFEARRLKIYQRLFFNNVRNVLSGNFPVAARVLGSTFGELVRAFYQAGATHTPYFTRLGREFIGFLSERADLIAAWPYLLSLMEYEWFELELLIAPDEDAHSGQESLLTGPVQASSLMRLGVYPYPVHQIRPDFAPTEASGPYCLLLKRNTNGEVKFQSVAPLSAALLQLVMSEPGLSAHDYLDRLLDMAPQLDGANLRQSALVQMHSWFAEGVLRPLNPPKVA
jgi:hypothetical protein